MKWRSPHPDKLPDFIIGGAMKAGTTTLHAILNAHPEIAIAKEELGFFDIDNILQHPDFNFFDEELKRWTIQSMTNNADGLWNWYYENFKNLKKEVTIIGEDSTTYLVSEIAAKRIALQEKPIKMIFIIRHPTERAISNYLHSVKSGRLSMTLEDTLRYNPNSILRRSLYREQLQYYYKHLNKENIKVVLFEDMISDIETLINNLCMYLGVEFDKFDPSVFKTHSNRTKIASNLKLQRLRNSYLYKMGDYRYSTNLPNIPNFKKDKPLSYKLIDKLHKKINPVIAEHGFEVPEATKHLMDSFFKTELMGLDELIGKDVLSKWFISS